MRVTRFEIEGLLLLIGERHQDQRGFLSETFRADILAENGVHLNFIQENCSVSTRRGVLRGLHFQAPPKAQGKLVRCTRGAIFDVAVDIRLGSPTYGRHLGVELSAESSTQLWIPPGFAHGFTALTANCEIAYKMTDYYAPECERGLAWDDPALGINWKVPISEIAVSEKDSRQPLLSELEPAFRFEN